MTDRYQPPTKGDHKDRPYTTSAITSGHKEARMTTEREILQALEGLPTSALEQIKDFILQKMGRDKPRAEIFRQRT